MKENEWLRFEKSGRVTDYLIYCQSDTGKYSEYEMCRNKVENYSMKRRQDGADLYPDGNDPESRSCGRV